ncbi:MAG: hypothetical protein V4857_05720 [Pseudomonadota bacterium]
MFTLPQILVAASAFIFLFLGSAHLLYTFVGNKLHPRLHAVQAAMAADSPVLTRQTTMWRAWIGFNASHSYGAMFFGLVYGYLALFHDAMLFGSTFLIVLGLAMCAGYLVLAKLYWFRIPFRGISLASALFVAALVVRLG